MREPASPRSRRRKSRKSLLWGPVPCSSTCCSPRNSPRSSSSLRSNPRGRNSRGAPTQRFPRRCCCHLRRRMTEPGEFLLRRARGCRRDRPSEHRCRARRLPLPLGRRTEQCWHKELGSKKICSEHPPPGRVYPQKRANQRAFTPNSIGPLFTVPVARGRKCVAAPRPFSTLDFMSREK